MIETTTQVFYAIIALLFIALIFSKQIHSAWMRVKGFNSRHSGVKVFTRKNYIDTKTREPFSRYSQVSGVRLALVSLITKV